MRSDAVDQLLSGYLKQPVRLSWRGAASDAVRGSFERPRVELAGLATAWVPLEEVALEADHVALHPGVPARLAVQGPRVEVAVGQSDLDRWLKRFQLPFRLELEDTSLTVHTEIAGFPVARLDARLDVVRGWFVLKPRSASLLGVPNYVASLFRTYLPIPPLPEDARVVAIDHEPEMLRLTFEADDFEERVTPGLVDRLRRRVLPIG